MTPVEYWNNKLDKALCIAFYIKRIIDGRNPKELLARIEKEQEEIHAALIEAEKAEKEDPNI